MSREYVLQPFRAPIHLQIDYARELNEQQYAAVTAPPGPSLVIAGAGSGKTRTLIYRVAYLLEQGIPPERILLLTFTNKAAKEMMRRVADLLGQELASLWGGTFHSIGNRILRQHAQPARLPARLHDPGPRGRQAPDQHLRGGVGGGCEGDAVPEGRGAGRHLFAGGQHAQDDSRRLLKEQYGYFEHLAAQIADIQQRYAARKRATNAMDFDDLLALWLRLMQEQRGGARDSTSGASSSSWWTNTRTRTSCRAT